MTETDLSDWLLVQDAADRIGVSTRTVERLKRDGKLEQRLRRQEGTPPVAVYNPEDVDRIASERRRPPAPFVLNADQGVGNGNGNGRAKGIRNIAAGDISQQLTSVGDDPIRQLFAAALRAVLSPPSPTLSGSRVGEPLFLTIAEAAAASGLSKTYLKRQCEAKTLKALRDGRRWKIKRTDLETL